MFLKQEYSIWKMNFKNIKILSTNYQEGTKPLIQIVELFDVDS